ncbi:MAG TPA: Rieske 2Fe-2S domain-containing protein, partial [Acidimicrobiales bacterium]|nr:Rieske 2Fe-2S domain-containing protein [Acidimicrobiales bacterium]
MSLVNESQPASPLAVSSYRYPAGWFVVAWSSDVAPGDVRRLHYFGRELVCFRTEGGEVSVLDAYCQHLGGHLGVGGHVE